MRFTYGTTEAVKSRLEDAYYIYTLYQEGDNVAEDYHRPWEIFKEEILGVITSSYANSNVLLEVIHKLGTLTMNYLCGLYDDTCVMIDIGFTYEALREIALRNQDIQVTESIIELCRRLRETYIFDEELCNRKEYYTIQEARLLNAILESNCINNNIAHKMIEVAPISFYETFIGYMNYLLPLCSSLSVYGRLFYNLYQNTPTIWPMMESIYVGVRYAENLKTYSEVTNLVMESAARSTDDVYKCIIGAMSNLVSQDVLQILSKHEQDVVRFALAFNMDLDISILESLAQDKVGSVKWRAIKTLKTIEKNEHLNNRRVKEIREVLERLEIPGYY